MTCGQLTKICALGRVQHLVVMDFSVRRRRLRTHKATFEEAGRWDTGMLAGRGRNRLVGTD
jgi:hypothetical protein